MFALFLRNTCLDVKQIHSSHGNGEDLLHL